MHAALQTSTHPAHKCQDCFPYCICLSCVYTDALRPPCKGAWMILHNSCSPQLLFLERESIHSLSVSRGWVPFCSFHLFFLIYLFSSTESQKSLDWKGTWRSSSPTHAWNWHFRSVSVQMWFVSTRYQGAPVNKDAFIYSWLIQALLWSLSWFSSTHHDKRFRRPCPWTPLSVGIVLSVFFVHFFFRKEPVESWF